MQRKITSLKNGNVNSTKYNILYRYNVLSAIRTRAHFIVIKALLGLRDTE